MMVASPCPDRSPSSRAFVSTVPEDSLSWEGKKYCPLYGPASRPSYLLPGFCRSCVLRSSLTGRLLCASTPRSPDRPSPFAPMKALAIASTLYDGGFKQSFERAALLMDGRRLTSANWTRLEGHGSIFSSSVKALPPPLLPSSSILPVRSAFPFGPAPCQITLITSLVRQFGPLRSAQVG